MSSISQGFDDRERYTLICPNYPSLVISEPIGWDEDKKEFVRDEDDDGIFTKLSSGLTFYGDAYDYLKFIYDADINAKPILSKEIKHPQTDEWVLYYNGFLDLFTASFENNQCVAQYNSGGLEAVYKARESEQLEIDRETTMDGAAIGSLQVKKLTEDGRRIFLQSKWTVYPENNAMAIEITAANQFLGTGFPMNLISKSHEEATDVTPLVFNTDTLGLVGTFFFLESLENRQLHIKGKLKFIVTAAVNTSSEDVVFAVGFAPFTPEPYYSLARTFIYASPLELMYAGQIIEIEIDNIIQILRGQSLSFEAVLAGAVAGTTTASVVLTGVQLDFVVEEDSFYEPTVSDCVPMFDLFERLTHITTGKKENFYSEFYGRPDKGYLSNGNGAQVVVKHGFWTRNFNKFPLSTRTNINPFKPLTTSFRDALQSAKVIHNVGIGIERIGFSERLRIEPRKYFYQPIVTVRLNNPASKIKRTPATRYYLSSLEIGYEKGGIYEEAMGLDEYNAKSKYTTCIIQPNPQTLISPFRTDSYGDEFTRRKQKFRFETTDTPGDNDIWMVDAKLNQAGMYDHRKWRDDFAESPLGTYDPESAYNLRFSPLNLILTRHAWVISAAFKRYLTKFLRYSSSTANSRLKTKLRTDAPYQLDPSATVGNGNSYAENDSVVNSELQQARFLAEYVEFDHAIDFDIMQQIEGQTVQNGKTIENKYGLFEFTNEQGLKEWGFLISAKPNGNGRIKLLTFNG